LREITGCAHPVNTLVRASPNIGIFLQEKMNMKVTLPILGLVATICSQSIHAGAVFEAQASIYNGDFSTTNGMMVGGTVNKMDWGVDTKNWGWKDQGYVWRVLARTPMIFQYYYDGDYKDAEIYIYNKDVRSTRESKLSSLDLKINGQPVTLSTKINNNFGIGGDKGEITKYLKNGLNVIEIKSGTPSMKHVLQQVLVRYFD